MAPADPGLRAWRRADIQIRDPFVLPVPGEGRYYLYGSTDPDVWSGPGTGFDAYRGADLETWEGPLHAFRPPPGFWGETNFWAPEVHRYHGRYHMLATFKAAGACRGTQVLAADHPGGPFLPHSDGAVTPRDWECLDGTLATDADGSPWMVFCHEWLQVGDGEICALPLAPDLRAAAGPPRPLFRASQAPWTEAVNAKGDRVTDGPFPHRCADGTLILLWSSFHAGAYALGQARARTGRLEGPWEHAPLPLYAGDGGHGMVFRDFAGAWRLALHAPNVTPRERAFFPRVAEAGGWLAWD